MMGVLRVLKLSIRPLHDHRNLHGSAVAAIAISNFLELHRSIMAEPPFKRAPELSSSVIGPLGTSSDAAIREQVDERHRERNRRFRSLLGGLHVVGRTRMPVAMARPERLHHS